MNDNRSLNDKKQFIIANVNRLSIKDKEHIVYILKINDQTDHIRCNQTQLFVDLDRLTEYAIYQIYVFVNSKILILNSDFI